jgi:hypothetical protein
MLPHRADQSGADDKSACSIDEDGHCQLGEAAGGAWASAGALGRESATFANNKPPANNVPAAIDAVAKPRRDIRCLLRDDAVTICCDQEVAEDTEASLCWF